jgi:hypothetical protein
MRDVPVPDRPQDASSENIGKLVKNPFVVAVQFGQLVKRRRMLIALPPYSF